MRILHAAFIGLLPAMMQAAAQEDQPARRGIRVATIEAGQPVKHFVLCDVDGDGLNDAVLVTGTAPALCVVARRVRPGFAPPAALRLPDGCDGVMVRPGAKGTTILALAGGAAAEKTFADFGPLPPTPLPAADPPPFLGFAADLDGDGIGDPVSPAAQGFEIALSRTGRRVPVRTPVVHERAAGGRGLLSERRRSPLISIETLAPAAPPRPCFFADDALLALEGTLEGGFGPGIAVVQKVPSSSEKAALERTEARLVDLEGDGVRELLVVRTKTQGSALAQVRTELIFHRIGAAAGARPIQAILLPGILSSGPEIKDVDKDGRLDLFLSVFGEDLKQQVARRITGKVRLDYLLYHGSASGPPFSRSPDFDEEDAVPEPLFLDWDLRHRLLLDDDWSGDGVPDLVRMSRAGNATRLEVRRGRMHDGKAGFDEDAAASAEAPVLVKDHRAWRLSPSEPAVICKTANGAVVFSATP